MRAINGKEAKNKNKDNNNAIMCGINKPNAALVDVTHTQTRTEGRLARKVLHWEMTAILTAKLLTVTTTIIITTSATITAATVVAFKAESVSQTELACGAIHRLPSRYRLLRSFLLFLRYAAPNRLLGSDGPHIYQRPRQRQPTFFICFALLLTKRAAATLALSEYVCKQRHLQQHAREMCKNKINTLRWNDKQEASRFVVLYFVCAFLQLRAK